MKYKAVIFDLFGTLVDKFPVDESIDILVQMAKAMEVPSDDLVKIWFKTFDERHSGDFNNLEEDTRYAAEKLGVSPTESQIKKAVQINLDYVGNSIKPRPDTSEILTWLKEHGYKVGLLSNWSHEVPAVWDSVPLSRLFDAAVFSSKVGMLKPDPHIYLLAAEKLEVKPEECLYIGDGASRELAGAAAVGMHPVLLDNKDKDSEHPPNAEAEEWTSDRITSLVEIKYLLE